jgi:thiol-disulfide isomerase/thioredoxin
MLAALILSVVALLGLLATLRPPQDPKDYRSHPDITSANTLGQGSAQASAELKKAPAAPDFAFPGNTSGLPAHLSALHGKVVVLDFWAPWCGPCRMSMPELDRVYRKLKPEGLVVVGIDVDNPPNWPAMDAIHRNLNISYPMLDIAEVPGADSAYEHFNLPTMYIIDKAGRLQHAVDGYDGNFDLEGFLEALLQQ